MSQRKLKASQVKPVTEVLLKRQKNKCPICEGALSARSRKTPALDHDHTTGYIRDVLCVNCNGIEGKMHNLVRRIGKDKCKLDMLERIKQYWMRHETPQHGGILHHTHKTEEEKRLARNARARKLRAKRKAE